MPWCARPVRGVGSAFWSSGADAISVVALGGERHRPEVLRKASALPVTFLSGLSGGLDGVGGGGMGSVGKRDAGGLATGWRMLNDASGMPAICYSPECVEDEFSEVRRVGGSRNLPLRGRMVR